MNVMVNTDDVIDSRDVIERAAELAAQWTDYSNREDGSEPLTDEEKAELDSLSALITQGENSAEDWEYGATLIRDSYFTEYAQELAEDIEGKALSDAHWPFTCIRLGAGSTRVADGLHAGRVRRRHLLGALTARTRD